MTPSLSRAALAATLAAGALPGLAATPINDHLSVSGFATAGLVRTDTDDAEFIRDAQRTGASRRASANVDSDVGLQLTAAATPWLSATVQMLSVERATHHLTTEAEWAFVKVTPAEGFALRGGRMALPMFLVSDSRNVGYANNWVRAPGEVYGLAMMSRLNGGDVTYSAPVGTATVTASGFAGTSHLDEQLAPNGFVADNVHGLNLQLETDWASFRLGQVRAHVHLLQTGGIADYSFTGAGVVVDRSRVFLQGEYVFRRSDTGGALVDASGWYALGGYRFGALLPYASHAAGTPRTSASPVHLSGPQRTDAAGLRWDVLAWADLKFQLEHIDTRGTNGTSFTGAVKRPVTAASLAVDAVF